MPIHALNTDACNVRRYLAMYLIFLHQKEGIPAERLTQIWNNTQFRIRAEVSVDL